MEKIERQILIVFNELKIEALDFPMSGAHIDGQLVVGVLSPDNF